MKNPLNPLENCPDTEIMKKFLYPVVLIIILSVSCRTAPEEIIGKKTALPEGVLVRQYGADYRLEPDGTTLVPLAKGPFELIFPVKAYSPQTEEFYCVQVLATNDASLVKQFRRGLPANDFPPMRPGTGLAGNRGPYDTLYVIEYGHHYIIYQPDEPDYQRGVCLGKKGDEYILSWPIDKVVYRNTPYNMKTIPTKGFSLVIFIDKNLNGVVDKDEGYIADLRFTEY